MRVDVSATASSSAGITSAGHAFSLESNNSFASAVPMTSISRPEKVM